MEERVANLAGNSGAAPSHRQARWRDLREWLALADAQGQLKRIAKPVDSDEEMSAIAFMATRREDAPALLFDNIRGNTSSASVLFNMLGASKARYALSVGIDPTLSYAGMIAATRTIMGSRIRRRISPRAPRRSTRWCCATTRST